MQGRSSGDRHIRARNLETLPEELRFALDEVTINETPRLVGSIAFANHRYPSDIDVFERVNVHLGREAALNFLIDQFKNIMQKIIINPNLYYSDFKAGEDYRFQMMLEDTSTTDRLDISRHLFDQDLVSKKEYEVLVRAAGDVNEFSEALRLHRVLRWTPLEVIRGYKELPKRTTITLKEALGQPSVVKLDTVIWSLGRYQALEVLYNLNYLENGRFVAFFPLGSYVTNLLDSIKKFSATKDYNPLKVAKRLWSLSLVVECTDLMKALDPILSSDAAAVNQVISDMEVLTDFMDRPLRKEAVTNVFLELLGMHKRLSNHLDPEDYSVIDKHLDDFFYIWLDWQNSGKLNRGAIVSRLNVLIEVLRTNVIRRSEVFLQSIRSLNITCDNPRFGEVISSVPVNSLYMTRPV